MEPDAFSKKVAIHIQPGCFLRTRARFHFFVGLCMVLLALLLTAGIAEASPLDEPDILIINSYHSGYWWSDEQQQGIIPGNKK